MDEKKVGVIINPIAGMGGRVGLKGTDSPEILERARKLGAEPLSPERALDTLQHITCYKESINLLTGPGPMGEAVAREAGFSPSVVGDIDGDTTSSADTKTTVKLLIDSGVDLLVFAGGDGTARDIFDAVGRAVPVIGIPTGVKIYSGVFCPTPLAAGQLVSMFIDGETDGTALREVMDIDEDAYRNNQLSATLYGYLEVPQEQRLVQNPKAGSTGNEEAAKRSIARAVADSMVEDTTYIIGPGTTTAAVIEHLGLEPTLLGVDAVRNNTLVGSDLHEMELLELLEDEPAKIVVGIIGGQGFVFGRGNQQLSWKVVEHVGVDNIIIVATRNKLLSLEDNRLMIDTGNQRVDEKLEGYNRVLTGLGESMIVPISNSV